MKKDLTELVFILDRSGSMSGLEQDTIGGYNSLLEKQKGEPGAATVTTVLFDDKYELLHDRINLQGVAPITSRDYFVRGSTALLDAIGRTVDKIKNVQENTSEEQRAETVMFVITTDGMENASREYDYKKVKAIIEAQKKIGWEFLFIGANIDAIGEASKFGITADRAVNYHADTRGTAVMYEAVGRSINFMRSEKCMSPGSDWKMEIEKDFADRQNGCNGEKHAKSSNRNVYEKLKSLFN